VTNGLTVDDQMFELLPGWGVLHVPSGLCVSAPSPVHQAGLALATCDTGDLKQQFKNDYNDVRVGVVQLILKSGGGKLLLGGDTGRHVFLVNASHRPPTDGRLQWTAWSYFPKTRQLRNQFDTITAFGYPACLSTCGQPPHTRTLVV